MSRGQTAALVAVSVALASYVVADVLAGLLL
jgi:hypothetical protein